MVSHLVQFWLDSAHFFCDPACPIFSEGFSLILAKSGQEFFPCFCRIAIQRQIYPFVTICSDVLSGQSLQTWQAKEQSNENNMFLSQFLRGSISLLHPWRIHCAPATGINDRTFGFHSCYNAAGRIWAFSWFLKCWWWSTCQFLFSATQFLQPLALQTRK